MAEQRTADIDGIPVRWLEHGSGMRPGSATGARHAPSPDCDP